jgi:hypothetical protein
MSKQQAIGNSVALLTAQYKNCKKAIPVFINEMRKSFIYFPPNNSLITNCRKSIL